MTLRLASLTAAVSLATDLGTGQPMEHALRTCALALRAATALGLTPGDRSTVLYTSLLRFLGCTADASDTAALVGGDEIAFNAAMAPVVMADDRDALPQLLRTVGNGLSPVRRAGRVAAVLSDPGGKARSLRAHCEVGTRLAGRIGLPADVTDALAHAYERWDGKGIPDGLAGDAIPMAMRIAIVARDIDVWSRWRGIDATQELLRRRRGRAYDPSVADVFTSEARAWLAELDTVDPWTAVLDAEPEPVAVVDLTRLSEVLTAFADFADLKSPWFVGHSRRVSAIAGDGATAAGLDRADVALAAHAGLVHDLGIVAVPAGVWNRGGPLTSEGWERVRLHPQVGERILIRCGLEDIAACAGAHHERADGSGYPRSGRDAGRRAQLVAAADVYAALTAVRPYRDAFTPQAAATELAAEADAGRFDSAVVDAVLAAAGHDAPVPNVRRPAGLTEREVDVLRLLARGRSNKAIASDLGISAKTVGTHVEHIYAKAGVSTRAGATVFAMEQDLLHT